MAFKRTKQGSVTVTEPLRTGSHTQSTSSGSTRNGGERLTYTEKSNGKNYYTTTSKDMAGYVTIKRHAAFPGTPRAVKSVSIQSYNRRSRRTDMASIRVAFILMVIGLGFVTIESLYHYIHSHISHTTR